MYDAPAPWTFDRLVRLLHDLRAAQRAYDRGRRKAAPDEHHRLLTAALDLEKRADEALEAIADRRPLFDREGPGPIGD